MRKIGRFLVVTAAALVMMSSTAFAGSWKDNQTGWYWEETDGTYPVSSWKWLDGNQDGVSECYYFDEQGYLLTGVTTPDGHQVDADGRWVVDGVVQTQGTDKYQTDAAGRYQAAMQKTNSLKDLEANAKVEMNMSAAGESFDMVMDMNLKMAYLNTSKIKFLADASFSMDGESQALRMFYTDGYCYMDIDGLKMKMAMPFDQMINTNSGEIQESQYLQDIQMREDENGNQIFTFVGSPQGLESVMNSVLSEMSGMAGLGSLKIGEYNGTVTVNREGYVSAMDVVLNYEAVISEMPVSYKIKMNINYINPGQQVSFGLPSTEGYTSIN